MRTKVSSDYYDLIEWAACQLWSSGAVGLLGVSYLAMSQWRVAALRQPSLKQVRNFVRFIVLVALFTTVAAPLCSQAAGERKLFYK